MRRALFIAMLSACGAPDSDTAPGDASPSSDAEHTARDAAPPQSDSNLPPDGGIPPDGKRVFVTSLRYSADLRSAGGQPTGRASADAICQTLADAAGLGGMFRAWLSTTDVHAIDHILGNGPWYRMDGAVAFPNRATLGTTPLVPISIDEKLGHPDPFYESWTGTALGGYLAPRGSRTSVTCYDWTSTIDSTQVGGVLGVYGEPSGELDGTGPQWTDYATGYCSPFRRHLYCFEQ